MADLIGQQFGNYRLTTLLGSGGFAEVYLGEHVRLGMQAAIKILHAHLVGEEAGAFQAEARIISELIHPHIIRVLDFDVEHGTPFLVLDYAPQGSLRQRYKRDQRVPLEQVVVYVDQVADALQYAHDRKHVHRDVKPANMLVGRQGEILLSDFGIASVAHSTSSMRTESPLGTLAYMSPEQIEGHARPASDQYALGITVYQWLTGTMPFRGSSIEIVGQQLGATPAPLRSIAPDIAPEVEQVVMTALAKDPRARFNSIHAFATELTQASQQQQRSQPFSYTAPTVVEPRKVNPQPAIAPSFTTRPILGTSDPALHTPQQAAQTHVYTQPPDRAQTYANTIDRTTQTPPPYLRPVVPYTPPIEQLRKPRIGWTFFWLGLALGVSLTVVMFFVMKANAPMIVTLGTLITLLGGMVGRKIDRSRQPIHPPAGGSSLH
ncbi:MAG: serine/threonine-protein kinase [Ktedonobacteraceae bacterium]